MKVLFITVYADSYKYDMFRFYIFRSAYQIIQRYESLNQIFPEEIDLEGKILSACTHHNPIYSEFDATTGQAKGLDVQLANLIARHMNGSLKTIFLECLPEVKPSECSGRMLNPSACFLNLVHWQLDVVRYGVPVLPFYSLVLLVPRGRPLHIYELLTDPYTPGIWWLIIWGSIARICVTLLSSRLSHVFNSSWKKTIKSLIIIGRFILTFVLLCGYEAKIVSFLANWPTKPDVTRINELRPAGMRVLMKSYLTLEAITADPRLTGIVQRRHRSPTIDIFSLDPNIAILVESETAKAIIRALPKYDHKTSQMRFVLLDERFDSTLLFYYFGHRNLIMHHFGTLLRSLYEAGIDQHWIKVAKASQEYIDSDESSTHMITFKQLKQWDSIFHDLWILCVIVFCIEICYPRLKVLCRKNRHFKIGTGSILRKRAQTYPLVCEKRRPKIARKSI